MKSILERRFKEAEEKFNSLCLLDNAIMNNAFRDNIPAVQHILQVIMEKHDLTVQQVKIQDYDGNLKGYSCTFDITATDSKGTHYNIEMQNDASGTSAKRSRYHSSMIDKTLLKKGGKYEDLPDSYVIFITKGDVFGYHMPIIHIDKHIRENRDNYDDGSYIIYVNALFNNEDTELSVLMNDLTQANPDNIKGSQDLKDALSYIKSDERTKTMFIDNYFGYEQKVWNEATAVATEKATLETKKADIKSFFSNGASLDLISKSMNMSPEEIRAILKEAH